MLLIQLVETSIRIWAMHDSAKQLEQMKTSRGAKI